MNVVQEGETVKIIYEKPRSGLESLGIASGTPLFVGKQMGPTTYVGEATTFSKRCGVVTYPVSGVAEGDGTRLVLRGQKPERNEDCDVIGTKTETLSFELK